MLVTSLQPSARPAEEHRARTPAAGLIVGRWFKYVAVAIWLGLLKLSLVFAGKLGNVRKSGAEAALPSNAGSTQVPTPRKSFIGAGTLPDADRARIAADARAFGRRTDREGQVPGRAFTDDGQAARVTVPRALGWDSFAKATDAVDALKAVAQRDAAGRTASVTGPAGLVPAGTFAVTALNFATGRHPHDSGWGGAATAGRSGSSCAGGRANPRSALGYPAAGEARCRAP
jgi:hypothetical protein